MTALIYSKYELIRTFRNKRMMIFSYGFPLAIYCAIAIPNRNVHDLAGSGISAPFYFMIGLAAFGAMNAVLAPGGRIASERSLGWNRQLRLTPLRSSDYVRAKLVSGYAGALVTIALLYAAGVTLGVRLPAGHWVTMTGLLLIGLLPFVGLGIALGHLLNDESIGPAIGGTTTLLALLGGTWFPITGGVVQAIAEALPSYWLVQASHVGLGGRAWSATGWAVVATWSVIAAVLAGWAYRRDTKRLSA